MQSMEDNSVDSVVTDPPYGLSKEPNIEEVLTKWLSGEDYKSTGKGFMGKSWDSFVPGPATWKEVFRVLKPGGYILCFAGTRTQDLMAISLRMAGFEIRDSVSWLYGCLSEDTEILTIDGWEKYHEGIINKPVLCYSVDKNSFEFNKPERSFFYENQHTAYRIQSDYTDQIVSRNHRCLVEREGRMVFRQAETLECEENIPVLEGLPDLSGTVYDYYKRAGSEEQKLSGLCKEELKQVKEGEEIPEKNNLPGVWERVLPAMAKQEQTEGLLFKELCRKSKTLVKRLCGEREGEKESNKRTQRRKEPRLEGWYNLFQEKGLLLQRCVNKICEVSTRIFGNGKERRVCYGTPSYNGSIIGQSINTAGVCSSYQSRPNRQQDGEFDVIQEQQGTQNIRRTRAKVEPIEYKGNVWCVQVKTGAFVARRNGKIFITGNSGFPKSQNIGKAIDKARNEDLNPSAMVAEWLNKYMPDGWNMNQWRKYLNQNIVGESHGGGSAQGWTTGDVCGVVKPRVPTVDQWVKLKGLLSLPDDMDAEVWRLNGNKGQPGENFKKREVVGEGPHHNPNSRQNWGPEGYKREQIITAPATPEAIKWEGWGSALKPAHEPIVLARKPLSEKTIAANVLKWGVGGLNIDKCRVGDDRGRGDRYNGKPPKGTTAAFQMVDKKQEEWDVPQGRFPANLIHDGSDEVVQGFPQTVSVRSNRGGNIDKGEGRYGWQKEGGECFNKKDAYECGFNDSGSAARFFYCAKSSKSERNANSAVKNIHPTCKPLKLMRYLCRLITPPDGIVLDPFAGSGSTLIAAKQEGFNYIGIELESEYIEIAETRLRAVEDEQQTLFSEKKL